MLLYGGDLPLLRGMFFTLGIEHTGLAMVAQIPQRKTLEIKMEAYARSTCEGRLWIIALNNCLNLSPGGLGGREGLLPRGGLAPEGYRSSSECSIRAEVLQKKPVLGKYLTRP